MGLIRGASIGAAWARSDEIAKADGVHVIPEWEIREFSFCYAGANPRAIVLEVGGKAVARPSSGGRPSEAWSLPSAENALQTLAANAHVSGAHHVAFVRARNEERALRQAGLLR